MSQTYWALVLEARQDVADAIRSFDSHYLTGRTSFFTRRPVVTKELQWLRDHVKECSKQPEGDRAWVVFGAGVGYDHAPIRFDPD